MSVSICCYIFAVFIGRLQHTAQDDITGLYLLYFKIIEPIKHDGVYISRYHAAHHRYACPADLNHTDTTDAANAAMVSSFASSRGLPMTGTVKVYSAYVLESEQLHLVAGSHYPMYGRQLLIICCVDNDETYAANALRNMIFRRICKC